MAWKGSVTAGGFPVLLCLKHDAVRGGLTVAFE